MGQRERTTFMNWSEPSTTRALLERQSTSQPLKCANPAAQYTSTITIGSAI
jgi:hypothetical protein